MKAFSLRSFDSAPEVIEIDVPTPSKGEVRVKVHAASVNGFDLAVANGHLNGVMEHRFPVVLGKDFAGIVDGVGAGVDDFREGDRVFGVVTKPFLGDGSFAEYVTVPVAVGIARLPDSVGFADAASLGLAGSAAVDAFDAAGISESTTVLIAGATGGVGNQAVQLAVRAGAVVIATATSPEEIEQVTGLGATSIVDYTDDVVAQVLASHPEGVDVVLHFAGAPAALATAVRNGGRFVSTLVSSPEQVTVDGIQIIPVFANPTPVTLERLVRNQAEKHTVATVQRVYDLDDTTEAFSHFAGGTLGKLVVAVG